MVDCHDHPDSLLSLVMQFTVSPWCECDDLPHFLTMGSTRWFDLAKEKSAYLIHTQAWKGTHAFLLILLDFSYCQKIGLRQADEGREMCGVDLSSPSDPSWDHFRSASSKPSQDQKSHLIDLWLTYRPKGNNKWLLFSATKFWESLLCSHS